MRCQPPEKTWSPFTEIAKDMVFDAMFLVFVQHTDDVSLDGPALDICQNALRHMYKMRPSAEGKQLRKPATKKLWRDLTTTKPKS